jgi:hypothetical protein
MWGQDRLTPVWKHLGGGCHLNRAIGALTEALVDQGGIWHQLKTSTRAI